MIPALQLPIFDFMVFGHSVVPFWVSLLLGGVTTGLIVLWRRDMILGIISSVAGGIVVAYGVNSIIVGSLDTLWETFPGMLVAMFCTLSLGVHGYLTVHKNGISHSVEREKDSN
jgi:riboflavin transporter FmnP